jgi:putative chitinase
MLEENLNYRAETLMKLWPKRFPTLEFANQYAKNPKKIANMVYSNRMGNRDEASGDGYRFRGRGCIQLTGHANYYHAGQALGEDFVMQPELVATPMYAALSAGFFWNTHKLNILADNQDIKMMTKRINGGFIGLADREKHYQQALAVLNT